MTGKQTTAVTKFRTRWRQVLTIDRMIRSGAFPNCQDLIAELEVSRRTVMRDIGFMRDDLGAPIVYDTKRRGYVYSEEQWSMPNIRLTQGDLMAIAIAEKAVDAFGDSPWAEKLREAFNKITAGLSDTLEVDPRDLSSRIDLEVGGMAIVNEDVLANLDKAIEHNRQVEMKYRRLDDGKARRYKIEPYLLLRRRGVWYLVAKDCDSAHVPIFNLSRIEDIHVLGSQFDYVLADFDRDKYLEKMTWAFHGQQSHRVVVDFIGKAARLIEERIWHPDQSIRRLKDGRVRFELTVHHLWDVFPWVMQWGSGARVVKPPELRRMVASEAKDMLAIYGDING